MSLIVIPKPIPPGQKVEIGQQYSRPTCDRCMRVSSERNPIILAVRKSHYQGELARGLERRDALCAQCRELMRRGW